MDDTFIVVEAGVKEITKYLVPMTLKPAFDAEAERQRERRLSLIINARQSGKTWMVGRFLERLKESYPEEVAQVEITKEPNKIRGYEGTEIKIDEMCSDEIQLRRTD